MGLTVACITLQQNVGFNQVPLQLCFAGPAIADSERMVLGNGALARRGGENRSVEQLRQAQELGVGAGPMYSDSHEDGWTRGTCQHPRSGADHRRITGLPLQWDLFDRADVGAIVGYVFGALTAYP